MERAISGSTKVFALIGCPVSHTLSPAMHNAAFAALGLDCVYVAFEVKPQDLAAALSSVRALGLAGLNVTVPHKEAAVPFMDELDASALLTGAVNTVVNRGGKLCGYNTDGEGFLRALAEETGFGAAGKTVLVLGAGGAARAVTVSLALAGAVKFYVAGRTYEKARALCRLLEEKAGAKAEALEWPEPGRTLPDSALEGADLVVQTTPLGMGQLKDELPPLPYRRLRPGQIAFDAVYNPPVTPFLREAKARGATAVGGLGMLVRQGALAFELWTGAAPPLKVMEEAALRALFAQSGKVVKSGA